MRKKIQKQQPASSMVTFYHDIEQNIDSHADITKCRQMVKEFLALEKKYGIPATYNVVGKLFKEQPDLIEWILQSGQEVAFHSFNHQSGDEWRPECYSDEIKLCREVSPDVYGYRSPRSKWDDNTLKTLWEDGFLWSAEGDGHKEPYFIYKGLVRLPIYADDWSIYMGDLSIDEWIKQFSYELKTKSYLAIGFHDTVASFNPEKMLKAWERVVQNVVNNKSLIVTFSAAADLYRRAAVARYYTINAKGWNRGTTSLYRSKRFKEMIRVEAEKLNLPVIADLGSGGGVLSRPLKDIASKIYCVDNSPGMVKDIGSDSCIQKWQGEVTDSNLPDNSCDLIICARIVEYLFCQNRLADEIKRIGKVGATFFVTFPALRETPPLNEGNAPNRIRKHFTPDMIMKWSEQIGPGRLIGIQYETSEPNDFGEEQRYREIENSPPPGILPTNWVFIGTIQNKEKSKSHREIIPISAFNFSFPSERYYRFKQFLKNYMRWVPNPIRKFGKHILFI